MLEIFFPAVSKEIIAVHIDVLGVVNITPPGLLASAVAVTDIQNGSTK